MNILHIVSSLSKKVNILFFPQAPERDVGGAVSYGFRFPTNRTKIVLTDSLSPSFPFLFLVVQQGQGQLIRAGGSLVQTLNSFQLRNGIVHTHPHQQAAEGLGKAGTSQHKLHRLDYSTVHFQFNFLGAGACGLINGTLPCGWVAVTMRPGEARLRTVWRPVDCRSTAA